MDAQQKKGPARKKMDRIKIKWSCHQKKWKCKGKNAPAGKIENWKAGTGKKILMPCHT
jgi:hypothetical protein